MVMMVPLNPVLARHGPKRLTAPAPPVKRDEGAGPGWRRPAAVRYPGSMLHHDATPVGFIGVRDLDRARAFYAGTLGLQLMHEDVFALVFDAGGTPLRVTRVDRLQPHAFTVFGWEVDDVAGAVEALVRDGVTFERFETLEQDERGIWSSPDGTRVAWFRDPDGNVLSITDNTSDL